MKKQVYEFLTFLYVNGRSAANRESYKRNLLLLISYLQQNNIYYFSEVTTKHLKDFLSYRKNTSKTKNISKATLQGWISQIKIFFRYLVDKAMLINSPAEAVAGLGRIKIEPNVLTQQEVKTLLEQPNIERKTGLRDRAFLELLYATGMRISEAKNLDCYSLDLAHKEVRIVAKGNIPRVLPLTQTSIYWLEKYLKESRPKLAKTTSQALFLSNRGKRINIHVANSALKQYAEKVGIKASAHSLRKACATHLLERGASSIEIKNLLGHEHLVTTEYYTKVSLDELRRIQLFLVQE